MEVDAFGETFANCTIAAIDINLFSKSVWPRDEGTLSSATRPLFSEGRFSEPKPVLAKVQENTGRSFQPLLRSLHRLDYLWSIIVCTPKFHFIC